MRKKLANLDALQAAGVTDIIRIHDATTRDGRGCTLYTLDRPLTDEQRAALSRYGNVDFTTCHYRYAPEICHDVVVLYK